MPLWHFQLAMPGNAYMSDVLTSRNYWSFIWRTPSVFLLYTYMELWVLIGHSLELESALLNEELSEVVKCCKNAYFVSFCLSQFGGKLITFGLTKAPGQQMQQTYPHQVFISQVTTETEFLLRSRELQMALQSGNLLDYCKGKIQTAKLKYEENLWKFLKVGCHWWSTGVNSVMCLCMGKYQGLFNSTAFA